MALKDHKEVYPTHNKFFLHSDGAGAFAGFGLLSRLGYLNLTIGVKVINQYTGESGGGKSSVDQIFGICNEELKRRVTKGMGDNDINDAKSLAKALNYKAIKKTINYAITFSRSGVGEPALNKSAREGRLQAHSARTYKYDDEGKPSFVELEEQSYLPVSSPPKYISLTGVWPTAQFPFLEIIPIPVKLPTSADTVAPGADAIRSATSLFISKVEKNNGLKERKEIVYQKALLVKEEKARRVQYRVEESERFAKQCGLKGYTLCPYPGCIRQFTSDARVEQHMICGGHQANGRPTAQSRNMLMPSIIVGQSIRKMSIDTLLNTVMAVPDNTTHTVEPVNEPLGDGIIDNARRFGWATWCTLKHPRFLPEALTLFNWLFEEGNKKGGSKCSQSTMMSFAQEYGTHVEIFEKEPFWTDAIKRSGGIRLLTDAQIPEEWQLKQFIGQSSTAVKQKQKCKAGIHDLSPQERKHQLVHYLSMINGLPANAEIVASLILGLSLELSCIKQKDFVEKLKSLGTFAPLLKRQILEACKEVGKVSVITPMPTCQSSSEEVDDEIAQDLYDIEHNNDDLDTEEVSDSNNGEVHEAENDMV